MNGENERASRKKLSNEKFKDSRYSRRAEKGKKVGGREREREREKERTLNRAHMKRMQLML